MTLGVILAGGQARRMGGGDKCLLSIGGKTLLSRVIDRLKGQVTGLAINANGDPLRFAEYGYPVLPDSEPEFPGPLAGVLAGMDWAAEQGADHIVTVAADTPFFPTDLVARLEQARREAGQPIALAATPDPDKAHVRHPTFGLWPIVLKEDLRQSLRDGTRKIVAWADGHGTVSASFQIEPVDPFFNLNRPEDMVKAETLLKDLP